MLLIGIGNEYRGDDGVGILIVRKLRRLLNENVTISESSGEGASLLELWQDHNNVFIFDAVRSHKEPGTIHRFAAHQQKLPSDFFHYSSHAFGLAEAVELGRALDQLPAELLIYGIEGNNFFAGQELTPIVEQAMQQVTTELNKRLEKYHA